MSGSSVSVMVGPETRARLMTSLEELSRLVGGKTSISRMPNGSYLSSQDGAMLLRGMRAVGGDCVIKDLVDDACRRAEALSPHSGPAMIMFSHHLLSRMVARSDSCVGIDLSVTRTADRLIECLPQASRAPTLLDISNAVCRVGKNITSSLVMEAMQLAGTQCKIFVERSVTSVPSIERTTGFTFKLIPNHRFYKNGMWTDDGVRLFIVDGRLINVSEIDRLLTQCNERNQPLAIFARGFSDDVISTLYANWVRGTLRVIPIEVKFDLDSVNVMNDIAVVAGTDVISSLKGELISTVVVDSLPSARRVTCRGATVTIDAVPNYNAMARHISMLREKRDVEQMADVRDILDRRIRSLSSNSVVIRVAGRTTSETNLLVQEVDFGLRTVNSVLGHGMVASKAVPSIIEASDDVSVTDALGAMGEWDMPTLWVVAILRFGTALARTLFSTGAVISIS